MPSASLSILIAFFTQAHAEESAVDLARHSHNFVHELVENVFSRVLKTPSSHRADLDGTMLGKPGVAAQPSRLLVKVPTVKQPQADPKGKTIANGKYKLDAKGELSTSGRAQIYSAYKLDRNGDPTGNRLVLKISSNIDILKREDQNYGKIQFGLFPGNFINKIEFLPNAMNNMGAIVMEAGSANLREVMGDKRGQKGLEGVALRDAAQAAAQCVQAVHSSGLVWTDIKATNFVVVGEEIGDKGVLPGVRGIDVEASTPRGKPPFSYTAEACPPEMAARVLDETTYKLKLDDSYDIWGYGMLLYELATGAPYFAGYSEKGILKELVSNGFEPDVSAVTDDKLRDLIEQCLRIDPKKRPNIVQILLHPYFVTTGIGPVGFKWSTSNPDQREENEEQDTYSITSRDVSKYQVGQPLGDGYIVKIKSLVPGSNGGWGELTIGKKRP